MARRRVTPMQAKFARHFARTGDATYAATKAGYASPDTVGSKMVQNELVQRLTRAEQQRFAREEAGSIAIGVFVEVALGKLFPANARVAAAKELRQMSGIGAVEGDDGRELHEMTGDELRREIARMQAHQDAMQRALADQSRPVIEHVDEQEDNPKSSVFE